MFVPHFFQSSEQTCGAACLRMLLAAFGVSHDEATIAQHCGIAPLGCTVQDLITGAQALGFKAALLPIYAEASARGLVESDAVCRYDRRGLPVWWRGDVSVAFRRAIGDGSTRSHLS